jgi:tetratricopeptide (TPR) repeat protein
MCAQGRYKQAIELVSPGEKELLQRASGNIVRGKALAGLGRLEEAERLVRDAVAVLDRTEMVIQQARAHSSLAEIMRTGGRPAEAVEHAGEAVRLLEQKGAVVLARRARALLAELAPGAGLLASTCARWPQGSKRAATGSKRLKPASLNHEESSREPRGNQHE